MWVKYRVSGFCFYSLHLLPPELGVTGTPEPCDQRIRPHVVLPVSVVVLYLDASRQLEAAGSQSLRHCFASLYCFQTIDSASAAAIFTIHTRTCSRRD